MLACSICDTNINNDTRNARRHRGLPHRPLRRPRIFVESEYVLHSKELALSRFVSRDARKIAGLHARIVSYGHLLLLVDLARIDKFLDRPSPKEAIDENVACLPDAVCTVHRL
jgi:hypothetical protein